MPRGSTTTWNPKAKWQPIRSGPVWDAFCIWFKDQNIDANRRAVAWRAFHAAAKLMGAFEEEGR